MCPLKCAPYFFMHFLFQMRFWISLWSSITKMLDFKNSKVHWFLWFISSYVPFLIPKIKIFVHLFGLLFSSKPAFRFHKDLPIVLVFKKKKKKLPFPQATKVKIDELDCINIEGGEEGDNRGWDGWMVSQTQWTWVWARLVR